MPKKPTSQDTIQKILNLHNQGFSYDSIVEQAHVGKQTVMNVVKGKNMNATPRPQTTHAPVPRITPTIQPAPQPTLEWSDADWNMLDKLIDHFWTAKGQWSPQFRYKSEGGSEKNIKGRPLLDYFRKKVLDHYHRS